MPHAVVDLVTAAARVRNAASVGAVNRDSNESRQRFLDGILHPATGKGIRAGFSPRAHEMAFALRTLQE